MTAPRLDFAAFGDSRPAARRSAAERISASACEKGFFYLERSGVVVEDVRELLALSRAFFELPGEQKLERTWSGAPPVMGYVPREAESLDESRPPDLKEAFNVPHPSAVSHQAAATRVWPDASDPLRTTAESLAAACFELSQEVLGALALALGLPEGFFSAQHRPEDQTLRLLHYFPVEELAAPRQLGAGEHSDHGTLTLLFQDEAGGLEFLDTDGTWQPLPPREGTVLVNAGDLLNHWTGGVVRSAPHRVRPGPRHRYSLAYFVIPRMDAVLDCPRTPVLAGAAGTAGEAGGARAAEVAGAAGAPFTAEEFLLLRSLRRVDRYYRHRGGAAGSAAMPKGLADMRRLVAERLSLAESELDGRLAALGQINARDAPGR